MKSTSDGMATASLSEPQGYQMYRTKSMCLALSAQVLFSKCQEISIDCISLLQMIYSAGYGIWNMEYRTSVVTGSNSLVRHVFPPSSSSGH